MDRITYYPDDTVVSPHWKRQEEEENDYEAFISPGEAITQDLLDHRAHRGALIELIKYLVTDGISWSHSDPARISPETAKAAVIFLQRLRVDKVLPQISPDGEGGLMLVWEDQGDPVVLGIQDWRMHLVTSAATPRATYRNNLPFDGEQIPNEVSKAIPVR